MTPSLRTQLAILRIAAFHDNYLWLIHDGVHAAVIDPGDANAINQALEAHGLQLTAILLTHHHADHIGGVPALTAQWDVPVYGPSHDGIDQVDHPLNGGERVHVAGLNLELEVIDVPGHTLGHIAYFYDGAMGQWLFCGDTLFGAGCGRLFEGTPEQMAASLARLAALPETTQVYCAHEYTLSNLRFARAVEPDNQELAQRERQAQALRAQGEATLPSTIALERATNPFLRLDSPTIVDNLVKAGRLNQAAKPVAVFAALRAWKDTFA